jgi:hypothetical protein
VAPPEALYCDLEGADLSGDLQEIAAQKMRIGDIRAMDPLGTICIRPHFDR